ncbi:MAG: biotin/lipoyl-binding protein [Patescibacteria group bacterium]
MLKKLGKAIRKHKITFIVVLLAVAAAGYFGFQMITESATHENGYQVEEVEKGDIESIVSTSGQVGSTEEVEVSAEASGKVTSVNVEVGQEINEGEVIAQIDSSELENNIYQAQLGVESAQLSLEKMKEPADASTIIKAENDLTTAINELETLELQQKHELEAAQEEKKSAKQKMDDTDKDDPNYDTYKSQYNEAKRKIEEYETNHPFEIQQTEDNILQKEQDLEEAKEGTDAKDIEIQEISIKEKQSQLNELIEQREEYYIKATISGVIASLNLTVGENVSGGGSSTSSSSSSASTTESSGSSSPVTIISNDKNATVTVNEVDVPFIEIDQKVYLTFDAIEDLEIEGKVEEIDLISTVDSGVVYNNVKISFNSQDDRIKSGMTVNAEIIIESVDDVLVVSGSAVNSQGDEDYVEVVEANSKGGVVYDVTPKKVTVETGATDDLDVEIKSGLEEGDLVVIDELDLSSEDTDSGEEDSGGFSLFGGGGMPGGNRDAGGQPDQE